MCEVCASMQKAASWQDVAAKGRAIYATGGVQLVRNDPQEVEFLVTSSQVADEFPVDLGGPYTVILSKKSWEKSRNVGGWIQGYLCACKWGEYHSGDGRGPGRWNGRFCFVPGTCVLMGDGSYKPIEDVEVGDEVVTAAGSVSSVVEKYERDYDGEIMDMNFSGSCFGLSCTPNHPFIVNSELDSWVSHSGDGVRDVANPRSLGYRYLNDASLWKDEKPAEQMSVGDLVLFAGASSVSKSSILRISDMYDDIFVDDDGIAYCVSGSPHKGGRWRGLNGIKDVVAVDADLAYIAGWYLAEGSVEGRPGKEPNSVRWTLNENERDVAQKIIDIVSGMGSKPPAVYEYPERHTIAVKVGCKPLVRLLVGLCGSGAKKKQLSDAIMLAPASFLREFIDAYWSGDGSVKGGGKVIYTASEKLAMQLMHVMRRAYGIDPSVHKNANSEGPTKRIDGNGRQSDNVIYHIDFGCRYAQRRYAINDTMTAHLITGISRRHYSGKVYNLNVDGEHTYIANGVAVHNCSHAYSCLLYATDNGIARGARGEFMNDRTASLDEPMGDEEGDVAWMAYVARDGSDIDGNVDYSMDENPRTGWYASRDEAMSKAASELADDDLDVEWHGGLTPGRTLIPWAESWQAAVFVHRCEWDGHEWLPDDDYDVVDLPGRVEYTDPYVTRQSVVDELAGMLPPECDIDLSWAPMSYETFYVAYGSLKIRVSGHQANADYGPCDVYLDVEDYPIEYGGVAKLASDIRSEIESFVDEVAAAGDEAGNEGLWLPKGACRMSSEAVGYCARCGAYGKVDVADWLCTACKDEETFNALVAATFGGDKDSELWLEAHADPERLAAISEQMEVADCDGVRLATWGGHRAAFTDDWGRERTATRRFTNAEMQELDDEIEGRELHNASRLKANGGAL